MLFIVPCPSCDDAKEFINNRSTLLVWLQESFRSRRLRRHLREQQHQHGNRIHPLPVAQMGSPDSQVTLLSSEVGEEEEVEGEAGSSRGVVATDEDEKANRLVGLMVRAHHSIKTATWLSNRTGENGNTNDCFEYLLTKLQSTANIA